MRLLFIGDIMGRPGRRAVQELLPDLRKELSPDLIIANGENAAGGNGFTPKILRALREQGIALITGGNHSFDNKEGVAYLAENGEGAIRPHNYPPGNAGRGTAELTLPDGTQLLVINLIGRIFLPPVDCPFRAADAILEEWQGRGPIFVDIHAEASSEKVAMARYLDGRVTAVVGTHTHVQTADERILPGGTALLSDAGMTGPHGGVIGMSTEVILQRFLRQTPVRFVLASEEIRLQGVVIDFDTESGRAIAIERVDRPLEV
jgi:2',3'-cyclic-nucleotide 2'-phosphodiesterase